MDPHQPAPTAFGPSRPDPAGAADVRTARARADEAARSVVPTFGTRLFGLPGTHLARSAWPARGAHDLVWNYWWQAHYLDAMVDAGRRHLADGDERGATAYAGLSRRLLRTMWLRNIGHFTNRFYDDMAWLVLAATRLMDLEADLGRPTGRVARRALAALSPKLDQAHTPDLGGGLFWTTARDRKNVPATAPAALHAVRAGRPDHAAELVEWLFTRLYDGLTGLMLDTVFLDGTLDRTPYTYNQGVTLGALLALGDPLGLARASSLIAAIDGHLRAEPTRPVLLTHGGGDGGLFTGILVRYLALAARDERLDAPARATASALVRETAEALWRGSEVRHLRRRARVFSPDATRTAAEALPPGALVELSPQLQAWTILEAAATLD